MLMTHFLDLSNYDKLKCSLEKTKLLLVDLDGTLIDFKQLDNLIIGAIFRDNPNVLRIDNLLWKINSLDVIGNGYNGLKLRLAVYSFFTRRNYKEVKKSYRYNYSTNARRLLLYTIKDELEDIINSNRKMVIVTKNVYAEGILDDIDNIIGKELAENIKLVILEKNKKNTINQIKSKYKDNILVVGNNLFDDIISSWREGLPFIYIGKSSTVKKIINYLNNKHRKSNIDNKYGICVDSISEITRSLKNNKGR